MKPRLCSRFPKLLTGLLLTCACIGIFAMMDRVFEVVTLAPLFGTFLLFALSLFLRPSSLLLCYLVVLPYVVVSLRISSSFDPTQADDIARFWVRTLTFGLIGFVAIIASFFRCRLLDMLTQTKHLLSELPVAVLLSNSSGRITWSNPMSNKLLGNSSLNGRLLLESLPSDGTPIDYNILFSSSGSDRYVQNATPDYRVRFVRLLLGHRKTLATVILPKSTD